MKLRLCTLDGGVVDVQDFDEDTLPDLLDTLQNDANAWLRFDLDEGRRIVNVRALAVSSVEVEFEDGDS